MPGCSAIGCNNKSSGKHKSSSVTFHRFPADEVQRHKWIQAVRRKGFIPTKYTSLCSSHFNEEDMDRTSLSCVRLRNGAVPSVFDAFPSYLKTNKTKRKPPKQRAPAIITPRYFRTGGSEMKTENRTEPKVEHCVQREQEMKIENPVESSYGLQHSDVCVKCEPVETDNYGENPGDPYSQQDGDAIVRTAGTSTGNESETEPTLHPQFDGESVEREVKAEMSPETWSWQKEIPSEELYCVHKSDDSGEMEENESVPSLQAGRVEETRQIASDAKANSDHKFKWDCSREIKVEPELEMDTADASPSAGDIFPCTQQGSLAFPTGALLEHQYGDSDRLHRHDENWRERREMTSGVSRIGRNGENLATDVNSLRGGHDDTTDGDEDVNSREDFMCDLSGNVDGSKSSQERYACTVCGKAFRHRAYLLRHAVIHTSARDKPYKCTVCSKAFGLRQNIREHMRFVHVGRRPLLEETQQGLQVPSLEDTE